MGSFALCGGKEKRADLIAFEMFVSADAWSDGKSDEEAFRKDGLPIAQLLAAMLAAIGTISGLLPMVFKIGLRKVGRYVLS